MALLKQGQREPPARDHVQMWSVPRAGPGGPSLCLPLAPAGPGKERGREGKGRARGGLGGDNAKGSALVAVPGCPDGSSSSPPLLQAHVQVAMMEAAASLQVAQKVEGKRRRVLKGSGNGVPVLGPRSPAATVSGVAGEEIYSGIGHP